MSDPNHRAITTAATGHVPERMHPLVAAAMSTGSFDPATLRDLLAVQREYEAGEARKSYARALVALKRDLPTVISRDKKVAYETNKGRTAYTHASLAHVLDQVTDALTAHGFSLAWTPQTTDRAVSVTCRLTHAEGHFEETTITAPPDSSGNKNPAQAVASTITLLQRYSACSLLGIATADMPDPESRDDPKPARVDADRNLRAVSKLAKHGRTREQAEMFLGKPVSEWTTDDLELLGAWVKDSEG